MNHPKLADETAVSWNIKLKDRKNTINESKVMINEISVIRWSPYCLEISMDFQQFIVASPTVIASRNENY